MTSTRHDNFRSFLTERFTAAAVEIFGEVEAIVEAYYEENRRLRSALHMVLNPIIKVPRIDDVFPNAMAGPSTDARHQPPEPNSEVSTVKSEPLLIQPKEEQMDCDISCGSTQGQGLEGHDNFFKADYVKYDSDAEEWNVSAVTELRNIQVGNCSPDTSETISVDDVEDISVLNSAALADNPISGSADSLSEILPAQNDKGKSKKKKRESRQKTVIKFPRTMHYKTYTPPNNCPSLLVRLTQAFKDFPDDRKPLITKMGLTNNIDFLEPPSVLSSKECQIQDDAPLQPLLPKSHGTLKPLQSIPPLGVKEGKCLELMQITWNEAWALECSTRPPHGHVKLAKELQKLRMVGVFREIRKHKSGKNNEKDLISKIQKEACRRDSAPMDEGKNSEVLRDYCHKVGANWYPCGLVVNPNAPWLGALPDGLVCDPKETPKIGLVHIKFMGFQRFNNCGFLIWEEGVLQLRKSHSLYWHIQGEMMVTGLEWCDLLLFSSEEILAQRIYIDEVVMEILKDKLDEFFFNHYLPSLSHY